MAELALDLDHDAIALLRRRSDGASEGGWERLGEARLDAPDLDARLRTLRALAGEAVAGGPGSGEPGSGGPVEAEIVIPDSQILYLDLDLDEEGIEGWDAMARGARRAALARALEGRTPHRASELAFDWHDEGSGLRVAVVTAETLREAEGFARAYGFAPARLRAWPDDEALFPATPDFGPPAIDPAAAGRAAATEPDAEADDASEEPGSGPETGAPTDPLAERASARAGGAGLLAAAVSHAAREARGRAPGKVDRPPAAPRRGTDRADEAEAMTVFGARGRPAGTARPRGRRLAIAGGMVALVALASTAALTLRPDPEGADLAAVAPIEPPEPASAPSASPSPEPRPFAAEPVVVPVPPAGAPTQTAEADADRPGPSMAEADLPTAPQSAPLTELDRARASYAATGIWQRPPEPILPPEAQEVAAPPASAVEAAAPGTGASPAALLVPPAEATADAPPAAMPPPPPPDAAFALGADGRVEATPEGAVTPDGITVYAAAPPRRPPARPAETLLASETLLPPDAGPRDPALADARPSPRPAAPEAERPDGASPDAPPDIVADALSGALAEALTDGAAPGSGPAPGTPTLTLGPVAPDGPAPAGSTWGGGVLTDGAAAASLFHAPDTLPEVTPSGTTVIDEGTASAFAVAASLRPYARPGDLAESVEAARGAETPGAGTGDAMALPTQAEQAAQAAAATIRTAAAPAPVAAPTPAPAAAAAAPVIPSRASVARRATVENALSMRQLTLMGVFGAEGARRALIRLPSGRFEKVKVGDRIDGGQVAAIGDGRLIYVRGGRNYAIDMPRQ